MNVGVMKKKKRQLCNGGFSLLEVLLAIVLLALVAAPILQTFLTTAKINQNAKKTLEATNLAQTIMEDITSQTFDKNIKNTFATSAPNAMVVAALGYSCEVKDITDVSIISFNQFLSEVGSTYKTSELQKVYFARWISGGFECFATTIHNVKYENEYFDVAFALTPSAGCVSSDKFYTYDVEMKVFYVKDGEHYKDELVTISGAVANKNGN